MPQTLYKISETHTSINMLHGISIDQRMQMLRHVLQVLSSISMPSLSGALHFSFSICRHPLIKVIFSKLKLSCEHSINIVREKF